MYLSVPMNCTFVSVLYNYKMRKEQNLINNNNNNLGSQPNSEKGLKNEY